MKKYIFGFLFFLCLTSGSLISLFCFTMNRRDIQEKEVQATESVAQPCLTEEEDQSQIHLVLNQESVKAQSKKYCLMAEEGYLIVYDLIENRVDLVTHMPVADFPKTEQERLMEGIWFWTLGDLFSYLESYSS